MTLAAQIDDRIEKCQRILDSDPNSQIFAALAEAYRKRGELDKAFKVCQNGLRVHPSYGSAHLVMAKINLDRGMYDWAEAEVNKAIAIDGNNRAIELLLAEIYLYRGEFASAIKLLKKLHQSDQHNEQIKKLLDIAQRLPEEQAVLTGEHARHGSAVKKPNQALTESNSDDDATVVSRKAEDALDARKVIRNALAISDIEGALFINKEGLTVESDWSVPVDPNTCAATMAEVDRLMDQELVRKTFGTARTILIESAGPLLYLVHVAGGAFLFAGNRQLNLGTLRMKIAALTDRFELDA